MKILRYGTVKISMKEGKPDILIEKFEIDAEGQTAEEAYIECLSWALEAMDNKWSDVNNTIQMRNQNND